MSRRRVVVTGLGLISPVGNTVADGWANLVAGKSGIAEITKFDASNFSTRFAGEVKGFNVEDYMPGKEARHMDTFIHYGIAAGVQAMQDSGLEITEENSERIGVVVGSGIGGLPLIEITQTELLNRGPRRISPFFVPASIINMISGHLSIRFGLKGPNLAIVTACTTGLHCIGEASRLIEYGDADVMIAGGSEATVSPLGVGGFAAARALSQRNDDPATASRPWDKDRDGFVLGEGAGVMVLEEYEHAKARGAKIYAEVSGYGMSGDAYHMTAPPEDGDGGRRSMVNAMKNAKRQPGRSELPERAWHVHAARRPGRDQRHQARFRRPREEHGREFDQIDDRAPARRRGRAGIGVHGAGDAPSGVAADHQHLQPGPAMRPGLLREHRA